MPTDKEARRAKADRVRKQIDRLTSPPDPDAADAPGMKPGESPNAYVQRRMRELDRCKPTVKTDD